MAQSKNQWVRPRQVGKWEHWGENNERATRVADTQKEAIESARRVAKKARVDLIVQGRDGQIVGKDSYTRKDNEH